MFRITAPAWSQARQVGVEEGPRTAAEAVSAVGPPPMASCRVRSR
jgi:hypothetical protein